MLKLTEPLQVLFVGDAAHAEFREPLAWLRARLPVQLAADAPAALQWLAEARRRPQLGPQLVVVAQSRPGSLAQRDIERLHLASPLSRLVALLGSYCEGEVRSGSPWPGVIRVYWHQWLGRCQAELAELLDGRASTWALPRTATSVDQALFAAQRGLPRFAGLVLIRGAKFVDFEGLADVCLSLGLSPVWLPLNQPPQLKRADLVIWDSDGRQPDESTDLKRWADRLRPAPMIYLRGFPRFGDVRQAQQAGADRVLSKPFLLDDLVACLAELLPVQETRSSQAAEPQAYPAA